MTSSFTRSLSTCPGCSQSIIQFSALYLDTSSDSWDQPVDSFAFTMSFINWNKEAKLHRNDSISSTILSTFCRLQPFHREHNKEYQWLEVCSYLCCFVCVCVCMLSFADNYEHSHKFTHFHEHTLFYLFVLSLCLFIHLSVCLSVHLINILLSGYDFLCVGSHSLVCVITSKNMSALLSVSLPVCLSVMLPFCLSFCLSVTTHMTNILLACNHFLNQYRFLIVWFVWYALKEFVWFTVCLLVSVCLSVCLSVTSHLTMTFLVSRFLILWFVSYHLKEHVWYVVCLSCCLSVCY